METGLKYAEKIVKKFGVGVILKTISALSWFFLPFIIWIQIYQYLGQNYFLVNWAIVGIVLLLGYLMFVSLSVTQLTRIEYKLARNVAHARDLFINPQDAKSEENFRLECSKFIIPYLHAPIISSFGITGLFRSLGIRGKVLVLSFQIFLHLYVSYSIMTLFITNQPFLNKIWAEIYPRIPYSSEIGVMLTPFFQNPIPSTVLVFIISLYTLASIVRGSHLPYSNIFAEVICNLFSIFNRVLLATFLLSLPWIIEKKNKTLRYAPFTFPTNLALIIQSSVKNIENKDCNVTKWSYLVEDEKDIEVLKYVTSNDKSIPWILRFLCSTADSELALKMIRESKPILFLGIIDSRCSIIGRIEYDLYEKLFRATFSFDNRHVKEEFKSIAEIQISEQKKLKRELPSSLTELIGELKLEDEK